MKKLLTIAILFCLAAGFAMAQDANEIVAKCKTATGAEKMKAVKTMIVTGTVSVPSQNVSIEFSMKWKDSLNYRFEQTVKGKKVTMVTNGESGAYQNLAKGPEFVDIDKKDIEPAFAQVRELMGYLLNPFEDLGEKDKVENAGTEKTAEGEMIKMKISSTDMAQFIYLDPVSFFPQKYSIDIDAEGEKHNITFNILDQKKIKGIVIPAFLEQQVDGKLVKEIEYLTVQFDTEIPDTEFKKP